MQPHDIETALEATTALEMRPSGDNVAPLAETRQEIDRIDVELRRLLLQRMDCSARVAQAKYIDGSTDVYRADREHAVLEELSEGISANRLPEFQSMVMKIMEASRSYQYHLLYWWNDCPFQQIPGANLADGLESSSAITVRVTRLNRPNAMSQVLCMIGDYGFNMLTMNPVSDDADSVESATVTFELAFVANIHDEEARILLFQLYKESVDFAIVACA